MRIFSLLRVKGKPEQVSGQNPRRFQRTRPQKVKQTTKKILRTSLYCLSALTVIILLTLLLIWGRLDRGPIDLAFAQKAIEKRLSAYIGNHFTFSRGEIFKINRPDGTVLRLRLHQAALHSDNEELLNFSYLDLGLNLASLLGGKISPNIIEIEGLQLNFDTTNLVDETVKPPKGAWQKTSNSSFRMLDHVDFTELALFRLIEAFPDLDRVHLRNFSMQLIYGGGQGKIQIKNGDMALWRQEETLYAQLNWRNANAQPYRLFIHAPFGFLNRFPGSGAQITIQTPEFREKMQNADRTATKSDEGIEINLQNQGDSILLRGQAKVPESLFSFHYGDPQEQKIVTLDTVEFHGIWWPGTHKAVMDNIRLRGNGYELDFAADIAIAEKVTENDPLYAEISLSMEGRDTNFGTMFTNPLRDLSLTSQIRFFIEEHRMKIDRLALVMEQSKMEFSGEIAWQTPTQPFSATLHGKTGKSIAIDDFLALWPLQLAPVGRKWIAKNISGGEIAEINARMNFGQTAPDGIFSLSAPFRLSNIKTTLIGELSPITNGEATGLLTEKFFKLEQGKGKIGALQLTNASFSIPDLDQVRFVNSKITFSFWGKVNDIFTQIDKKPMRFLTRSGLDPADFSGVGQGNFAIAFPIVPNLQPDDIDWQLSATAHNVTLRREGRRYLSGFEFTIKKQEDSLLAQGKGKLLGGGQGNITWRRYFDNHLQPYQIDLGGEFDLGFLTRGELRGVLFGVGQYTGENLHFGDLQFTGSLRDGAIPSLKDNHFLVSSLASSMSRNVTFRAHLHPDGNTIANLHLSGRKGKITAKNLQFNPAGKLVSGELSHVSLDDLAKFSGNFTHDKQGKLIFTTEFDHFLLSRWRVWQNSTVQQTKKGASYQPPDFLFPEKFHDFAGTILIKNLHTPSGHILRHNKIALVSDKQQKQLRVTMNINQGDIDQGQNLKLTLRQNPENPEQNQLFMQAQNIGALLRYLDIYQNAYAARQILSPILSKPPIRHKSNGRKGSFFWMIWSLEICIRLSDF